MKTVGIRFRRASKIYTFDAGDLELNRGDHVVVETERGVALGLVAEGPDEPEGEPAHPLKQISRLADEKDLAKAEKNEETEDEAWDVCLALIREKALPMKLLDIEMMFDRSKMIFCFASEGRVDFRELVRDLARHFHTRIEMRQVGVRDEAKMIGGVGSCGRELCCATWLTDFAPISVRMAKSQNISLNPAKISGICGRLMCCLAYENKMYEDMSKGMPKVGKKVLTQKGEGRVIRRNALEGSFTIIVGNEEVEVDLEAYDAWRAGGGEAALAAAAAAAPAEEAPAEAAQEKKDQRPARREERPRRERPPKPVREPRPAPEPDENALDATDEVADETDEGTEGDESPDAAPQGEAAQNGQGSTGERPASRRRRRRRRKPPQARENG